MLTYNYQRVFETLKAVLVPYAKSMVVVADQIDTYYLNIPGSLDTPEFFFSAVQMRSGFVTFHFAGLPKLTELLDLIPQDLCIIQNVDGSNFLVFKTIKTHQLKQIKKILQVYSDIHMLSFTENNVRTLSFMEKN